MLSLLKIQAYLYSYFRHQYSNHALKQPYLHRTALKSIVYVLLAAQLWVNTIPYWYWLMDAGSELFEYANGEGSTLKIAFNAQEQFDNCFMGLFIPESKVLNTLIHRCYTEAFASLHLPEIIALPPNGS